MCDAQRQRWRRTLVTGSSSGHLRSHNLAPSPLWSQCHCWLLIPSNSFPCYGARNSVSWNRGEDREPVDMCSRWWGRGSRQNACLSHGRFLTELCAGPEPICVNAQTTTRRATVTGKRPVLVLGISLAFLTNPMFFPLLLSHPLPALPIPVSFFSLLHRPHSTHHRAARQYPKALCSIWKIFSGILQSQR